MLDFARKYSNNIHSQFGEDGILEECIKRIHPKEKTAVEFGAPSFFYCSNTAHLYETGWKVTMFDIDPNADTKIQHAKITPENVNELVGTPSVLSIDTDGECYNIWKAYTGKSDIVIIEVNSSIPPTEEEIPGPRGASYRSMVKLGIAKGYFLVCHTGNCIFALNKYRKLFPEITGDPLDEYSLYFNTSHI